MEDLKEQLRAAEEARDRLRQNMQFLKTKIIDTGQLVQLYQQTQGALRKEQEEAAALRAQLAAARQQVKAIQDESAPLKEKYEQALVSLDAMKLSLEKKDTQLHSSKALIDQLQADVADGSAAKKDRERLQRDLARMKKDIGTRDATIKEAKDRNEELMREVSALKGALAAALAERKTADRRAREREEERVAQEAREAARRRTEEVAWMEDLPEGAHPSANSLSVRAHTAQSVLQCVLCVLVCDLQ